MENFLNGQQNWAQITYTWHITKICGWKEKWAQWLVLGMLQFFLNQATNPA
jgi:hypothetical protein